eukprot:scaffold40948_cov44-Attheya_sp.AAC.2
MDATKKKGATMSSIWGRELVSPFAAYVGRAGNATGDSQRYNYLFSAISRQAGTGMTHLMTFSRHDRSIRPPNIHAYLDV